MGINEVDDIKRLVAISTLLGTSAKKVHCPLPGHDDKHPSCVVDHAENTWRCFVCDKGGTIFDLIMERDRRTFKEALQELADIAGVKLRKKGQEYQEEWDKEQRVLAARAYAVDYYHKNLLEHEAGMAYWSNRGINLEIIQKMKLGWSDGKLAAAIQSAMPKGLSRQDFLNAGLIKASDKEAGKYFDWFDIRAIFPLIYRGKVVNISGRATDYSSSKEKYRHLKGVPIQNFYNEAALGETVWLFEGHPDTLSGIQVGLPAVGIIGTSGMVDAKKLAHCQEIYICGDNDTPGEKAVESWAKDILKHNPQAKIICINLPEGVKDFNDWLVGNTGPGLNKAFDELLAAKQSLLEYKINRIKSVDDLVTVWPYLENLSDIQRDGCYRMIKEQMPFLSIVSLRKDFKTWENSIKMTQVIGSSKILDIDFKPSSINYLNIDFNCDEENRAHICLYGQVKRLDETDKEVVRQEPILIQSSVDTDTDTYKPERIMVCDFPLLASGSTIPMRSMVARRWGHDSIQKFLSGEAKAVATHKLAQAIADYIKTYIWFPNPANYEILAFYVMGTYVARIFKSYPYLTINGLRQTGKSNTLDLMYELCFNSMKSVNSSIAATFRVIQSSFVTWIRDEAEQFNKKTPENADELTILNAGYKSGNTVSRIEKNAAGNMEVQEFDVFGPKIFGSINVANDTLLDRSILIKSHRAPRNIVMQMPRFNQCRREWEASAAGLRNSLYVWTLTKFPYVKQIFEEFPGSSEIINREWELWLPLFTLAYLADHEAGVTERSEESFLYRLQSFASDKSREKKEVQQDDNREIKILEAVLLTLEDNEVHQVYGHAGWYQINEVAQKVTELFKKEGYYKEDGNCSTRRLTRAFDQTNHNFSRGSDIKVIKIGAKSHKCIRLSSEEILNAISSL